MGDPSPMSRGGLGRAGPRCAAQRPLSGGPAPMIRHILLPGDLVPGDLGRAHAANNRAENRGLARRLELRRWNGCERLGAGTDANGAGTAANGWERLGTAGHGCERRWNGCERLRTAGHGCERMESERMRTDANGWGWHGCERMGSERMRTDANGWSGVVRQWSHRMRVSMILLDGIFALEAMKSVGAPENERLSRAVTVPLHRTRGARHRTPSMLEARSERPSEALEIEMYTRGMTLEQDLEHLRNFDNDSLFRSLKRHVGSSNRLNALVLAHFAEVDARGAYRDWACDTLAAYCIYELRLSEDEAQRRCRAARVEREFPVLFSMLADASIHLTAILLLAPYSRWRTIARCSPGPAIGASARSSSSWPSSRQRETCLSSSSRCALPCSAGWRPARGRRCSRVTKAGCATCRRVMDPPRCQMWLTSGMKPWLRRSAMGRVRRRLQKHLALPKSCHDGQRALTRQHGKRPARAVTRQRGKRQMTLLCRLCLAPLRLPPCATECSSRLTTPTSTPSSAREICSGTSCLMGTSLRSSAWRSSPWSRS